jgi:pyruvyl transferase EpsO
MINSMSTPETVLSHLKSNTNAIAAKIGTPTNIIYVDYPLHPNIGDLLINSGTEEFFANHNYLVTHRYSYHDYPKKLDGVNEGSVFAFHGGGNFGDLYPEHINLLLQIIEEYPNNQVVVFPQTVFFKSDERRAAICSKLKKHRRLTIYVRDRRSLDVLTRSGLDDVSLMPDMAHLLLGAITPNPSRGSDKPLYFMRRDEEVGSVPNLGLSQSDRTVDWEDGISLAHRVKFAALIRMTRSSRALGVPFETTPRWYKLRDELIDEGIKLISQSNLIYTNRLHAMLLALLLQRDVVGFDNSYGKLSGYYETWLADIEGLQMLRS